MKVLVTGGLGFIGSNLAERLVKEGHDVSILDNLHTGNRENLSINVKIFEMDAGDIDKTCENYEIVFHNGIYSSSPMYKKDPSLTAKAIGEWISMLEYAKSTGCKIIFACSSSVYNGQKPPHKEDMEIKVTDYYTEARYAMERLAKLQTIIYEIINVKGSIYAIGTRPSGYLQYCANELMEILHFCDSPLYNFLGERYAYCQSFIGKKMTKQVVLKRLDKFTAVYLQRNGG